MAAEADPARLGPEAGPGQHPQRTRTSCADVLQRRRVRPGPRLLHCPGSSGFTGIAYNPKRPAARRSTPSTSCFTDPTSRARSRCSPRCATPSALALLALGKDPANFTDDDFNAAIAYVRRRPRTPGRSGASPATTTLSDFQQGDIAACIAWTGDVVQLRPDNRDIGTSCPTDGHMLSWSDNILHPQQGPAQEERRAADQLLLRPDGRGACSTTTSTTSRRSTGAKEELLKLDPDRRQQPADLPHAPRCGQVARVHAASPRPAGRRTRSRFQQLIGQAASRHGQHSPRKGSDEQQRRTRPRQRRRPPPDRPHQDASAPSPPSTTSTSPSRRARSSPCSAPPAAARRPRCGWSPGWRTRPPAGSSSATQDVTDRQAVQAPGQHGLPELRALPAPGHLRERRLRPAPPRHQGRQEAGRRHAGPGRARPPGPAQAAPALRRPAAARRAGPRPDQPARRCCCSTSRSAPSTSSCAARCRSSSSASRPRSASPSSTSPTTRRRP